MRAINTAFSHVNLVYKGSIEENPQWSKPVVIETVLKSEPFPVNSYDELVKNVAQILHRNRNLTLFYRGQSTDYKDKIEGKTTILPSIYRKKPGETKLLLKERFDELKKKSVALNKLLHERTKKLAGTLLLKKYPEIAWSILQHYEICPTPLLDITHSLHVASSFAFDSNTGKTGTIYVLGMPWATDALGYNSYEELVNIRLLSVCPPQARRPFFQEGYLAGPFPNYGLEMTERVKQFDFARRLIAKFQIPIKDSFWGEGFSRIPHNKLYPENDTVLKICSELK